MNVFKIRKKSGSYRTIYAPSQEEKLALRAILWDEIEPLCEKVDKRNVQHGFRRGRSAVTNAMQHVGYDYTLSFDLKDFFDTVKPEHVPQFAQRTELWPDGAARQGLPTSPALANIAAAAMDEDICAMNPVKVQATTRRMGVDGFVYTRYADDLAFSFDDPYWIDVLKQAVPALAEKHGFKINPDKTTLQWSGAGRRMITGIAVDKALHPPRSIKRRLRAAKHQRNTGQWRGLYEWASLTPPKEWVRLQKLARAQSAGARTAKATERPASTSVRAPAPLIPWEDIPRGRRFGVE